MAASELTNRRWRATDNDIDPNAVGAVLRVRGLVKSFHRGMPPRRRGRRPRGPRRRARGSGRRERLREEHLDRSAGKCRSAVSPRCRSRRAQVAALDEKQHSYDATGEPNWRTSGERSSESACLSRSIRTRAGCTTSELDRLPKQDFDGRAELWLEPALTTYSETMTLGASGPLGSSAGWNHCCTGCS
jgi:hypothetical protein